VPAIFADRPPADRPPADPRPRTPARGPPARGPPARGPVRSRAFDGRPADRANPGIADRLARRFVRDAPESAPPSGTAFWPRSWRYVGRGSDGRLE